VGFDRGGTDLAAINFASLNPVPLTTDLPIDAVFDIARADKGRALIAIHNDGAVGATVFDALNPVTATSRRVASAPAGGPMRTRLLLSLSSFRCPPRRSRTPTSARSPAPEAVPATAPIATPQDPPAPCPGDRRHAGADRDGEGTLAALPPETAAAPAPARSREAMWRLELGYRGSFVPSAGYDPFSTNDSLPQFSAAATRTLFAGNHLSFATGIAWDIGSSSAIDRGDRASIGINRLTIPLEGRVHFGVWGYAFVRGAPGVLLQHTEVDDHSAAASLNKTRWLFASDLSAGYAWLAWPRTRQPEQPARLWLQADGGYGWVARERLDLGPALASGDARIVSGVDLGTISLSGPFFRVAAAASF